MCSRSSGFIEQSDGECRGEVITTKSVFSTVLGLKKKLHAEVRKLHRHLIAAGRNFFLGLEQITSFVE
jgi:hypothetical protein